MNKSIKQLLNLHRYLVSSSRLFGTTVYDRIENSQSVDCQANKQDTAFQLSTEHYTRWFVKTFKRRSYLQLEQREGWNFFPRYIRQFQFANIATRPFNFMRRAKKISNFQCTRRSSQERNLFQSLHKENQIFFSSFNTKIPQVLRDFNHNHGRSCSYELLPAMSRTYCILRG